jgi:phage host-nuclease inhibitor protein Gam
MEQESPTQTQQTEYSVVLKDATQAKTNITSFIRTITDLSIAETKKLIDKLPATIITCDNREEADLYLSELLQQGYNVKATIKSKLTYKPIIVIKEEIIESNYFEEVSPMKVLPDNLQKVFLMYSTTNFYSATYFAKAKIFKVGSSSIKFNDPNITYWLKSI